MHAPVIFRYVSLTFFAICSLIMLALAGSSISQTKVLGNSSAIVRVGAFILVDAILGLLAVFVVFPSERRRPSAFTSKIYVEVCWVVALCILDLCAATAVTAIGTHDVCASDILPRRACVTMGALQAFTWLACFTLLFHVVFVVACIRLNIRRIPDIWHKTIVEVEWAASSASSKSGSFLPTHHEKQVPVYTAGVKPHAMVENNAPFAPPPIHQQHPSQITLYQRTSELSIGVASVNATPPLYPQFIASSQPRAVVQQSSSFAGRAATPNTSANPFASHSGRSTPESTTSSEASPVSSPSSQPGSASSSRPSSPRTKRRPPPLNLAGLSAFNAVNKSKQRQDRA